MGISFGRVVSFLGPKGPLRGGGRTQPGCRGGPLFIERLQRNHGSPEGEFSVNLGEPEDGIQSTTKVGRGWEGMPRHSKLGELR